MIPRMDASRVSWIMTESKLAIQYDKVMESARMAQYAQLAPYFRRFSSTKFDPKYAEYASSGRCYNLAYNMAKETGLTYVEGLLMVKGKDNVVCAIGHAWCATGDGMMLKVLDPAMASFQHRRELMYVGVPLHLSYVEKMASLYGNIGVLDGNPNGPIDGVYVDNPEEWLVL